MPYLADSSIKPPDREQYRRSRASGDVYTRSLQGPIFYTLACALVAWFGGRYEEWGVWAWLPAIVSLLLFPLRASNRPPQAGAASEAFRTWETRHWATIFLGVLLWSAVFIDAGLRAKQYPIGFGVGLISTIAFATALSQAFALHPRRAFLMIAVIYLLPLGVFGIKAPEMYPLIITMALHFIYLLLVLHGASREYNRQVDTEFELIVSRHQIEMLTRIDALTGIANRREYQSGFQLAWQNAKRNATPLSLMILDLDFFKRINDRHGHLAGDQCLRHVAGLLGQHFRRAGDLVARIGGEEFVVLLPGMALGDAVVQAERFRATLAATAFAFGDVDIPLTTSIGVGQLLPERDASPEAGFERIDQACYRAKQRGRNAVVAAE